MSIIIMKSCSEINHLIKELGLVVKNFFGGRFFHRLYLLEMALRGRRREPFYTWANEEASGVSRPKKGKVRWAVDDKEGSAKQDKLMKMAPCSYVSIAGYAEAAGHDINHRIRSCRKGKTSRLVFFKLGVTGVFSKMEWREIYGILIEEFEEIWSSMNPWRKAVRDLLWRIAVESWPQSRGFI